MRPLELMRRVTARVTQTYLGRLKTGEIPAGVSLDLARQAAASAPQLVLADATRGYAPPDAILQAAEATRGRAGALLIVMDSVHSWVDGCEIDATEYEKINAGLMQLRALAHRLECPVLAIAERNRMSMKTGGMSAGAGSRKIEYGAETVLDLSVPEDALENASGEKSVKLRFSKNRNGAAGSSVDLAFHGALQRFTEQ
jgi:replicative DNA helicase